MKKTMAMLLSAAMVMSMGLMASAATQDYSVLVDGGGRSRLVSYSDIYVTDGLPAG